MRWNDIEDIAEALEESYPDEELESLRLGKLHRWIIELLDFDDDPGNGNERILEAVQSAWEELRNDE